MKAHGLTLAMVGTLFAMPVISAPYRLPDEQPITLPAGPDVELAEAHCAACHSLDYVRTQPRGKGPMFWRDAVTKMIKVYGAPLTPEEADKVSAYLARTYG